MVFAWMFILIWFLCGILSWGLFFSDLLNEFEESYQTKGLILGKDARLKVKAMFISAFIMKLILGLAGLVQIYVYKLIMKSQVRFVWFPPSYFWTKYFAEK